MACPSCGGGGTAVPIVARVEATKVEFCLYISLETAISSPYMLDFFFRRSVMIFHFRWARTDVLRDCGILQQGPSLMDRQ